MKFMQSILHQSIGDLQLIRIFKASLGIRDVLLCLDSNNYKFCVMPDGDLNTIGIDWERVTYGTPEPSDIIKPPFRVYSSINDLRNDLK